MDASQNYMRDELGIPRMVEMVEVAKAWTSDRP